MSGLPLVKDFGNDVSTDHGYEVVTVDGVAVANVLEYDLTGANPWVRVATEGKDAFGNKFSDIKQLKQGAFVRTVNNTKPHWGPLDDDAHNFYLGDICGVTTPDQAKRMGGIPDEGRRWFPISQHLGITDEEDAQAIDAYVNEGGFALDKMDFADVELRVLAHMSQGGSVTGRVRHDVPNYADEPRRWRSLYMGEFEPPSLEEQRDPKSKHFNPAAVCPRMVSIDIDRVVQATTPRPYAVADDFKLEINIVCDGRGTFGASDREAMAEIAAVIERHYPSASRFNNRVRRF